MDIESDIQVTVKWDAEKDTKKNFTGCHINGKSIAIGDLLIYKRDLFMVIESGAVNVSTSSNSEVCTEQEFVDMVLDGAYHLGKDRSGVGGA